MTKLILKLIPALIIGCFLSLMFLPYAVNAETGYSVEITTPSNGDIIKTPKFSVQVKYTYNDTPGKMFTIGVALSAATVPDDQAHIPPQQFDPIAEFQKVSPGSGLLNFSIDITDFGFDPGKHVLGVYVSLEGYQPGVDSMIIIDYQPPAGQKAKAPVIDVFRANRDVVVTGKSFTLTWQTSYADSITISNTISQNILNLKSASGNISITPTATVDYTVTVTNAAGSSSKTVTVGVAADAIHAILYMYNKLNLTGHNYGLGSGNGAYADVSHCASGEPPRSNVMGTIDGKEIRVGKYDDDAIVCGSYQGAILEFLDTMRTSPNYKDLFDNVEYGPVSTYDGVLHHWVVVYPKNTNWKNTGYNLDPWPTQKLAVYPNPGYAVGNSAPDTIAWPSVYPLTGAPSYPSIPSPKQKLDPPKNKKQIIIHCPVNALITNQLGQRVGGLNADQLVNEIPGAGVLKLAEDDGTNLWYILLPPDGTYKTAITGTSDGSFQLFVGAGDGTIQDYGNQPISQGKEAQITLDPNNPAASLMLPNGKNVTPSKVNLQSPSPSTNPPAATGESGFNGLLVIGIVAAGIIIVCIFIIARYKPKRG